MRRFSTLTSCVLLALGAGLGPFGAREAAAEPTSGLEDRVGAPECRKVPACNTEPTPVQKLKMGQPMLADFSCPSGTYFWNWSAIVGKHVFVTLKSTKLDKKNREIGATFEYFAQSGNGSGKAKVYLACSKRSFSKGGLQHRRVGYGWNPHERS
ncbi:hypothetical protein ACFOWB_01075 [Chenggangzhangella methanolivorans]|uniref:hypothetical protein n=1 Tax=Chenggangzhangella methanolivorans TaxID=1437009 RepID=UPI00360C459B